MNKLLKAEMDYCKKQYSTLIGKKIIGVNVDEEWSEDVSSPMVALIFEDGTRAFVLRDEEGNGGGYLEIQ